MANGDTDLSICSNALMQLGEKPISDFEQGTDGATICSSRYLSVKRHVLAIHPWTFTFKKERLARLSKAPAAEYDYAYPLPPDRLNNIRRVYNSQTSETPMRHGFEIIGDELLTNEETIYVDYQYEVRESEMPGFFVELLTTWFASVIAVFITDQLNKGDSLHDRVHGRGGLLMQAKRADRQGRENKSISAFPLIEARR